MTTESKEASYKVSTDQKDKATYALTLLDMYAIIENAFYRKEYTNKELFLKTLFASNQI